MSASNWAEIEIMKLRRIFRPIYGKNEKNWPDHARRQLGRLKGKARMQREYAKAKAA